MPVTNEEGNKDQKLILVHFGLYFMNQVWWEVMIEVGSGEICFHTWVWVKAVYTTLEDTGHLVLLHDIAASVVFA